MGTHLTVLCESYPINTNMTGLRWLSLSLCPGAFDKSSLSIGRVKSSSSRSSTHGCCLWAAYLDLAGGHAADGGTLEARVGQPAHRVISVHAVTAQAAPETKHTQQSHHGPQALKTCLKINHILGIWSFDFCFYKMTTYWEFGISFFIFINNQILGIWNNFSCFEKITTY